MDSNTDNDFMNNGINDINSLFPKWFIVIIILFFIIFLFYLLISSTDNTNNINITTEPINNNNFIANKLIWIIGFILGIIICIKILKYFFGIDIKNIFKHDKKLKIKINTPRLDAIKNEPVPEILLKEQVFNIPGNEYDYNDAKALCSAYGARLATYGEIENAYNNGGEWCNYGWSDGQMALFPTQQNTYDTLQKIDGHQHDCGRPGVNGGYINNQSIKFGVNCYGFKPKMTPEEENLMANQPIYPKTFKDIMMDYRIDYWKEKASEILVSPFNHKTWSRL